MGGPGAHSGAGAHVDDGVCGGCVVGGCAGGGVLGAGGVAGGGGFGDPADRDRDAVARDLAHGLISEEAALVQIYQTDGLDGVIAQTIKFNTLNTIRNDY